MTEHEIGKWISRGHFRPSAGAQRGRRREYDWRDLACLAFMNALRPYGLSLNEIALSTASLREDLDRMDGIHDTSGLYFFQAKWRTAMNETVGLFHEADLVDEVLRRRPKSILVVDVARAYWDALRRLQEAEPA